MSPLSLQKGAAKVAAGEGIVHVTLTPESTTADYVMGFLSKIFMGSSDEVTVSLIEHASVEKYDESGRRIDVRG